MLLILQAIKGSSRCRRGSTLIEMNMVVFLLLVMATLVLPGVVALKRSSDARALEDAIARLPIEAKNEARKSQVPVVMKVDGSTLVISRQPDTGALEEVKHVDLGTDFRIEKAQQNGQDTSPNEWQWTVYPDGSADAGGLEFSEGSKPKAMVLSKDGGIRWLQDRLPETGQDQWQAGMLQPPQGSQQ